MEKERFLDESFENFDSSLVLNVDFETLKQIAGDYKKYNIKKNGTNSVLGAIESELLKEKYGVMEES